jgi:hypothetical protein
MAEDIQVDGEKTGERTRLWVRNGCGKGAGHAAGNEWMVGKGEPRGPPRRGEWMTHGSRGKAEERIKRQEEGPHWLNTGQLRGAGLHDRR